jgi:hypothetical protein
MLRDRPSTRKAGIPAAETKSAPMGDDPLAIYKPTDAKSVDAAKAVGSFSGARRAPSWRGSPIQDRAATTSVQI